MLVMCGLSFLLLLLIATRIIRSITEPLDSLSSRFKAMTESNDLRLELDQERNDEIGALGLCLNTFVHKLNEILAQMFLLIGVELGEWLDQVQIAEGKHAKGLE